MSQLTRLASTDSQEHAIAAVEQAFKQVGALLWSTTIGKAPQTVIIDIRYQDSSIHVDSEGLITITNKTFRPDQVDEMAEAISATRRAPTNK